MPNHNHDPSPGLAPTHQFLQDWRGYSTLFLILPTRQCASSCAWQVKMCPARPAAPSVLCGPAVVVSSLSCTARYRLLCRNKEELEMGREQAQRYLTVPKRTKKIHSLMGMWTDCGLWATN